MRYLRRSVHFCGFLLLGATIVGAQEQPASQPIADSRPASVPASQPTPQNLLVNGDFEHPDASGKLPAGWTTMHPENVRLIEAGGAHGRVVEMSGRKKLMASHGVDLTGEPISINANTRYRCTGYTRSNGPRMKVFVKGYATVTRGVAGEIETFDDVVYQMRKDIEPSDRWQPFNLDFAITPAEVFSDFQHEIKYVRVCLWAYWPVGTCWFDDIRFEEVGSVAEDQRRHDKPVTHVGVPPRLGSGKDDEPKDAEDEADGD